MFILSKYMGYVNHMTVCALVVIRRYKQMVQPLTGKISCSDSEIQDRAEDLCDATMYL